MGPLLAEYLNDNTRLSLPGLGTFYATERPAEIQFASRSILPPSRTLEFQSRGYHETDPGFVHYLHEKTGMSRVEAEDLVGGFSTHARRMLTEKREFEIPGLGKLSQDLEGAFYFLPDPGRVFRFDSFGLRAVPAETVFSRNQKNLEREVPVIPLHPFDEPERSFVTGLPERENRRGSWFLGSAVAAAVVIAVSAVVWLGQPESTRMVVQAEKSMPQEAALVPMRGKEPFEKATPTLSDSPTPVKPNATEAVPPTPSLPATTSFFVIGGSFQQKGQMEEAVNNWEKAGYSVSLHAHPDKPFTRVALGRFQSREAALQFLESKQGSFKEKLWLLAE